MVSSLALLQRVHVGTHHQPRYGASLGQWDGQLPSPSSPGEGVAGRVPGRRATARLAAAEAAAAGGSPKMDTLPLLYYLLTYFLLIRTTLPSDRVGLVVLPVVPISLE